MSNSRKKNGRTGGEGDPNWMYGASFESVEELRAGLKVYPERDEGRLEEAHFTAQAQCFMALVHLRVTMCHFKL